MAGLWNISTQGVDPGIGIVVWQGIVLFIILIICVLSFFIRPGFRLDRTHTITRAGIISLLLYFACHWADLVVRHNKTRLKYSYIVVEPCFTTIRFLSEIFSFMGTLQLLASRDRSRPRDNVYIAFLIAPLWLLGFYQQCLRFAISFSWLSFANINTTNSLATSQSNIDATYTALLFVIAVLIFGYGLILHLDTVRDEEDYALTIATGALFLRSFCQVIIVGQLYRTSNHSQAAFRGFDATYGLFSIAFVAAIEFAIPLEGSSTMQKHQAAHAKAVTDVRQAFNNKLRSRTSEGLTAAPSIPEMLKAVSRDLHIPNKVGILEFNPMKDEIDRIARRYKSWQSIPRVNAI